jgi:hypothetical protein
MRIRPGDRPPGAEVGKSPLNVELLQALEGRSGNWAALRPFEGGLIAHPRPRYTTAVRALDARPARALVRSTRSPHLKTNVAGTWPVFDDFETGRLRPIAPRSSLAEC